MPEEQQPFKHPLQMDSAELEQARRAAGWTGSQAEIPPPWNKPSGSVEEPYFIPPMPTEALSIPAPLTPVAPLAVDVPPVAPPVPGTIVAGKAVSAVSVNSELSTEEVFRITGKHLEQLNKENPNGLPEGIKQQLLNFLITRESVRTGRKITVADLEPNKKKKPDIMQVYKIIDEMVKTNQRLCEQFAPGHPQLIGGMNNSAKMCANRLANIGLAEHLSWK